MDAVKKLYINGEFKETSQSQKVINPSSGEVIAEVFVAGDGEVDAAISAARLAFDEGEWRRVSFAKRKECLLRISQGILDNAAELARLETLNTGKPIKESTFMDIPSAAKTFEHVANNFAGYLADEIINVENAECRLVRQPMGVVTLIVPWNYPLLIACWKLASALAAGNTVILKPASLTPLTVLELAKIIDQAGLPKGAVNVVNGPGARVGQLLCVDKRVDMISFTGSNEVGRQIINYASTNVKKLIMELGGKSAGIILKDADLELAINGSLCSIFLNQGQMCTAMSRIFVEDGVYEEFLQGFVAKTKQIKLGDGLNYETQMGPLISDAQRKKVIGYVEKAKAQGAKLLCGGNIPDSSVLKNGFFFTPAVFTDVSSDMEISREEVFGPVVCISKFSDLENAINLVNDSDFGLAATIWTKDALKAQALAKRIDAGIVWVNTYGMFYNEASYGGFKQSGFGKELGRQGLLEYTRLKNTVVDTTQNAKPLVNYWYSF